MSNENTEVILCREEQT